MNSTDVKVNRVLESWLADGPSEMPERALNRLLDELETTSQRRPLWLPGRTQMSRTILAIGGLTALLIVIVGGTYYLGWLPGGSGFGTNPVPTETAFPGPTAAPQNLPTLNFSTVAPGSYAETSGVYEYVITVPAGWRSAAGGSLIVNGTNFDTTSADFAANSPDFASVGLPSWWGDQAVVYTDPCHWQSNSLSTGNTATDFAEALSQIAPMSPTSEDITVGTWHGKHVRLTVPNDVDFRTCDQGKYWGLEGRFYQAVGQVDEFWILDLADGDRGMFGISYMPGTSQEVKDQLRQMVDSVEVAMPQR